MIWKMYKQSIIILTIQEVKNKATQEMKNKANIRALFFNKYGIINNNIVTLGLKSY